MEENPFIFSDKFSYRLGRHLSFWMIFLLHFALQNVMIGGFKEAQHTRTLPELLQYVAFFFPVFVISSYIFMYKVIPDFLYNRKISRLLISLFVLLLINLVVAYSISNLYVHISAHLPYDQIGFDRNKFNTIVNGFWIPLIVMGLSGGIRLTKKWILQEKANEFLVKQKISRELKILKIQIHPRFLFHSLNSLEDKLKNNKPDPPGFILKLADLMSYILYESDTDLVLLEKEIDVIRSYMDLQKNNYPDSLHTKLDIQVKKADIHIAPLILLSFLDVSFEYLLFREVTDKTIWISINTNGESLHFNMTCSEEESVEEITPQKPIWSDIIKRLESLYPDNHQLILKSNKNDFFIELRLNLVTPSAPPQYTNSDQYARYENA